MRWRWQARGARVLVNDLGGAVDGSQGGSVGAAQAVVDEIRAAGGTALANCTSVTDSAAVQAMVDQARTPGGASTSWSTTPASCVTRALPRWTWTTSALVVDVHVMGAAHCTEAVWDLMKAQKYGRIVFTTSSSGLFGNFGQANYGAAKMALVGLMQTLALEGEKYNIRVNALAPTAATRMTEGICCPRGAGRDPRPRPWCRACWCWRSENAPTRTILCAGRGHLGGCAHHPDRRPVPGRGQRIAPEQLAARMGRGLRGRHGEQVPRERRQGTRSAWWPWR